MPSTWDIDIRRLVMHKESYEQVQTVEKIEMSTNTVIKGLFTDVKVATDSIKLGENVFHDLEMFKSFDGADGMFTQLCHTQLCGSRIFLKTLIENPISDIDILKARQRLVISIESFDHIQLFETLKRNEHVLDWMFNADSNELSSIYNMVYFTSFVTKPLNKNGKILSMYNVYKILGAPLVGLFTPLVYFIIPYFVLWYKFKIKFGFSEYIKLLFQGMFAGNMFINPTISIVSSVVSLIFYFQNLFNSFEISKAMNKINKLLVHKMNSLIEYITAAEEVYYKCWNPEITRVLFKSGFGHYECCEQFKSIPTKPYSLLSMGSVGEKLRHYKTFSRDKYLPLLERVHMIDALLAISKLKDIARFSFPVFSRSIKPVLELKGVWHPSINPDVVVKNNINVDKNIILTGPNAGGKSTLIKSVLISIVLAQSFALTNCQSMKMTPLHFINSQMNVPDCKGKESLFEAEMMRSKENLDKLSELEDNKQRSIIVIDEMFNSTNPIEGIAGAYAIAKQMAKFRNNLVIITTHYVYLTRLAKEFPMMFTNIKMNVCIDETTNVITFPYKLQKGISTQCIALELLRKNGFDANIIDDAMLIKQKLGSSR
jgi:hypothetical protein